MLNRARLVLFASLASLALVVACGTNSGDQSIFGPEGGTGGDDDASFPNDTSLPPDPGHFTEAGPSETSVPDACVGDACGPVTPQVICGDGVLGGSETCDDGNAIPGDGCSGVCTIEP